MKRFYQILDLNKSIQNSKKKTKTLKKVQINKQKKI